MIMPLQITFKDLPPDEKVEERIRAAAEKLDHFSGDIMSCRAVVSAIQARQRKGQHYHIRLDVTLPGKELVVNREPGDKTTHTDILVAVRDAFNAMERMVRDYSQLRRGEVKRDSAAPHARINRLYPDEGYGFIETLDGREIYFHRNSVLDDAFTRLKVGTEVRFAEEKGEKGAQASTVDIVGREAKHDDRTHSI
jgi:cold shock CspA family protein/ribosome-associated translation inhibitor RaiA